MPLFEYQCKDCQNKFEEIVTISSQRFVTCPKCKSKNLEKLISAPSGIISKGNASCPSAKSCSEVASCCNGKCPHQ
ncbi:zinc ribbon domain-containing protein [bacterium]|nr:zinc ribbon domain-containing protein [bacterium]MBU1918578.1 zinc ribbon domain-containing protein [bacterium]